MREPCSTTNKPQCSYNLRVGHIAEGVAVEMCCLLPCISREFITDMVCATLKYTCKHSLRFRTQTTSQSLRGPVLSLRTNLGTGGVALPEKISIIVSNHHPASVRPRRFGVYGPWNAYRGRVF